jgi:hypothetical protein
MENLKLAYYVCLYVAAFLAVAVFAAELWKFTKLIPFLFLRAWWWIRSLFSKKSEIHLKPTGLQFTGTLNTLDIISESETAQLTSAKPLFNRSEFAKGRKRNAKGHFLKA